MTTTKGPRIEVPCDACAIHTQAKCAKKMPLPGRCSYELGRVGFLLFLFFRGIYHKLFQRHLQGICQLLKNAGNGHQVIILYPHDGCGRDFGLSCKGFHCITAASTPVAQVYFQIPLVASHSFLLDVLYNLNMLYALYNRSFAYTKTKVNGSQYVSKTISQCFSFILDKTCKCFTCMLQYHK